MDSFMPVHTGVVFQIHAASKASMEFEKQLLNKNEVRTHSAATLLNLSPFSKFVSNNQLNLFIDSLILSF